MKKYLAALLALMMVFAIISMGMTALAAESAEAEEAVEEAEEVAEEAEEAAEEAEEAVEEAAEEAEEEEAPAEEAEEEAAPAGYSAEPLAEGDIDELYHVAIVGAEAFSDAKGKDAVRFYYEFTNNSDSITSAWWALTFSATQDGFDLVPTSAPDEEIAAEFGNDALRVMPGATILCTAEYNFKSEGSEVVFFVSDYGTDPVFYCFEDAANLPGRPMDWTPVAVAEPDTFVDFGLTGETDNITVNFTDAEDVTYDEHNFLRVYFDITNNTDEAISPDALTTFRAYQDNIELSRKLYLPSSETDDAYFLTLDPGATVQASYVWDLRTMSPVSVIVMDYAAYSTTPLCAATVNVTE